METMTETKREFEQQRPKQQRHVGIILALIHRDTNGKGGYGYIADEVDGQERFFHKSWITDSIEFGDLYRGQRLTFFPISSRTKGERAINLRRLFKERVLDKSFDIAKPDRSEDKL